VTSTKERKTKCDSKLIVCSQTNLKGTTLLSDSEIAQKSRDSILLIGRVLGGEVFFGSDPSRFRLNVSAGSQKKTIHKPEGRDKSRCALYYKRNLNVTIVKYILSLLGQTLSLFFFIYKIQCLGQTTVRVFGRCV
jgi:hypothetical protein